MGLTLENIKYKNYLDDITILFARRRITGLYGDNANYLLSIINGDISDNSGLTVLEREIIDNHFFKKNPTAIALISSDPYFYTTRVKDEFKFNLDIRKYDCSNLEEKEEALLNSVGLDKDILQRDINTLSTSEKYLLNIALNLIYEPDVILFKDIFVGLDYSSKKRIKTILNNLKEDKRIIIITSKDINIIYEITDEVVLLDGNHIYKNGQSDKIFTSLDVLRECVIPMPSIIKVSYLAKIEKRIKLSYHNDVRDIIKDIYKHV